MKQAQLKADKDSTVGIFFVNGINSILGWNAVLASYDFFAKSFQGYNIYSYLAVPFYLGTITAAFTYHATSTRYKYVHLIVVGNMIVNLGLLALLLVALLLPQTLIGFTLVLILCYFVGLGMNLSQLTFYAMINYLSENIVSKFTIGTSLSGLFFAFFRVISTLAYGANSDSNVPIMLYFAFSIVFNTVDMIINTRFCSSQEYSIKIERFLLQKLKSSKTIVPHQQTQGMSIQAQVDSDFVEKLESKKYFQILYKASKEVMPFHLIILVNFLLSITFYPGIIFQIKVGSLEDTWLVLINTISYGLGDAIGKYFVSIKNSFNYKSLLYVFYSKIFFCIVFSLMAVGIGQQDVLINNYVFPFVNVLLYGFTVGFCTNAAFIMAFKVAPLAYKKYAGVLCSLTLQVGLMLGTVCELLYSMVLGIS